MSGLSYHPLTGVVYNSTTDYDLGYFIARLYLDTKPSIAAHVRTLSLNLPQDSMANSGILNYLNAYAPEPEPHQRLPGDLGIAADMCRSLLTQGYGRPELVNHRRWFQVIVRLLRCCEGVETIEVPAAWGDVTLYAGSFPGIHTTQINQEKRQLSDGRWRFGKDPVVVREDVEQEGEVQDVDEEEGEEELPEEEMVEEREERSMQWE